ncbi:MAG: hypothetical protein A3G87_03715 [Omnitrophica bacterium RIFCSPLOWO2_12_FULL_50_11]|nr:MAG: hypothetical protein A3G87_03715 [Omnitrophica bacterium RIFCSPLOWO2_12_FULL_50_11]
MLIRLLQQSAIGGVVDRSWPQDRAATLSKRISMTALSPSGISTSAMGHPNFILSLLKIVDFSVACGSQEELQITHF